MGRRLTIYGNWSAYDELSDGLPLTEELAMRQFDELIRLRNLGCIFDAYLMDAFWFDPTGGYRTWRKPNWPDGPQRWFEACAQHGLMPGLWFTANTLCHIECAALWADSADSNEWGLCCFHGGFLADYLDVLSYWYDQGVRIFKLDFADFSAAPQELKTSLNPAEIRERNIDAFREGLSEFRREHPEAIVMGFNGFEDREYMDRTDRPLEPVLDLRWLDVFDSIYGGDPRPADVPAVPFWRSVDIYGDHMTHVLARSGVPNQRIDNCGFMAGPTGTCYRRGKAMWKAMLLLTLARGGDLTVLYGDLSLFDDDDARWIAAVQTLFESAFEAGGAVPIGGLPGAAEPYGWVVGRQLCAAVNPGPLPTTLDLPGDRWQVLFRDRGFVPAVAATPDRGTIGPYQMVLFGIDAPSLGLQDDCVSEVAEAEDFQVVEQNGRRATIEVSPGRLRVIVRQRDGQGRFVRTFAGPHSMAESIIIRARQDSKDLAVQLHHDRVVWSGMSWGAADIAAIGDLPVRIEVAATDPQVAHLDIEVWRLTG